MAEKNFQYLQPSPPSTDDNLPAGKDSKDAMLVPTKMAVDDELLTATKSVDDELLLARQGIDNELLKTTKVIDNQNALLHSSCLEPDRNSSMCPRSSDPWMASLKVSSLYNSCLWLFNNIRDRFRSNEPLASSDDNKEGINAFEDKAKTESMQHHPSNISETERSKEVIMALDCTDQEAEHIEDDDEAKEIRSRKRSHSLCSTITREMPLTYTFKIESAVFVLDGFNIEYTHEVSEIGEQFEATFDSNTEDEDIEETKPKSKRLKRSASSKSNQSPQRRQNNGKRRSRRRR